jgi:hypothetical protein
MEVNLALLIALGLATLAWWAVMPLRAGLNDRKLGSLAATRGEEPGKWPRVSVLVPAKNEQDTLFDAMQGLLRVDYPNLEIVIIDDRSTDRTGEIAERLAAADPRVRTLHIDKLPHGWLGKVHALHRGIGACDGEWLLFTDADVHFSPRILKLAIAHCLRQRKDFLALFPDFVNPGLLLGSAQAAFGVILLSMLDFARIADPDSRAAMGIGAFNLARRSFIDTREGLDWLRMEVADDAGLGLMMKRRGAAIDILSGSGLLRVDWYPTLSAMMDGVMQRVIMGANYYLVIYLLHCLLVCFCLLAPLGLAVALLPLSPFAWLCLGAYLMPPLLLRTGSGNFDIPRASRWAISLGYAIIAFGMLRTLISCIRRGGIYWRGNIYPLKELRDLQRVKMTAFFLP